jgi:calcium-dependent protein kinase
MGCTPTTHKISKKQEDAPSIYNVEPEILSSPIAQKYHFIKLLGQGGMGKTYLCKAPDGEYFALQRIMKARIGTEITQELVSNFYKLQTINNPYIIKFYELYEEPTSIYIVMEYCSGEEVFDKILSSSMFTEIESASIVSMMLHALQYLHSAGIVHCDVKPQNVMFANKTDQTVKLIDFNLCKFSIEGVNYTPRGTPEYLAPEIIEGRFSSASDIWSIGVIIYIFLSGEFPFRGESTNLLYKQIKEGHLNMTDGLWKCITEEAKDLIRKCICVDPAKRITAAHALTHPWFERAKKMQGVMINEVRQNFASMHLLHKLHKAMKSLISRKDWIEVLPRLREMFVNENGSEKISLKVRDLKDALKEVNLHATMDELQSVLNKFNKGDSDQIHLYHLFSPKQMKKHRQHSCNDLNLSKFSATS